jgi:hypothetical protein
MDCGGCVVDRRSEIVLSYEDFLADSASEKEDFEEETDVDNGYDLLTHLICIEQATDVDTIERLRQISYSDEGMCDELMDFGNIEESLFHDECIDIYELLDEFEKLCLYEVMNLNLTPEQMSLLDIIKNNPGITERKIGYKNVIFQTRLLEEIGVIKRTSLCPAGWRVMTLRNYMDRDGDISLDILEKFVIRKYSDRN